MGMVEGCLGEGGLSIRPSELTLKRDFEQPEGVNSNDRSVGFHDFDGGFFD